MKDSLIRKRKKKSSHGMIEGRCETRYCGFPNESLALCATHTHPQELQLRNVSVLHLSLKLESIYVALTSKCLGSGKWEINNGLCCCYIFSRGIIRSVFLSYLDVSVYIPNQEKL